MNTQTNQERPQSIIKPGTARAGERFRRAAKELDRRLAEGEKHPKVIVELYAPIKSKRPSQAA